MDIRDHSLIESFKGTLAYGRQAITLLFAGNALAYHASAGINDAALYGMAFAAASAGAAYMSQSLDVAQEIAACAWFRWASIASSAVSGVLLLAGG